MPEHLFWLADDPFDRLKPLLPNKGRGVLRGDDRKVIRYGLKWRDAPACYGPHKTLYNRFVRWSRAAVFDRIFQALAAESTATATLTIDSTHRGGASHRRQPAQGGAFPRQIGRTRGGLNWKLHAVCDGKPVVLVSTAGQVSDYCGADTVLDALPEADVLIADKGYDSDRLREALAERGIKSCIPGRAKCPSSTTPSCTRAVTSLSACSADSKIGAASPSGTTAVRIRSSVPSA